MSARATLYLLLLPLAAAVAAVGCNLVTGAADIVTDRDGAGADAASGGNAATGGNLATGANTGTGGNGATGGDTGVWCGNAVCDPGEDCESCLSDCGGCAATCGNAVCDPGEDCVNCPGDCGACAPVCGDGQCNGAETCSTCVGDCGACPPGCGDGQCNGTETCSSCADDCGACPPVCGDGQCNGADTCSSCPSDCGACPPVCGDGQCNGADTCSSCPGDCGACAPDCGDGQCNGTETCSSCVDDCAQGAGPATTALDAEEQAFLVLLNNYRAQNGLGSVSACTSLNRAAQGHSEDMRDQDYFSHTGLNGSSPWDRACWACYALGCGPQTAMAENIAAGNSGAQATFDQWRNSPGHNANMLGSSFTRVGLGRAVGGGTYGVYWTNVFGGASEPSCN